MFNTLTTLESFPPRIKEQLLLLKSEIQQSHLPNDLKDAICNLTPETAKKIIQSEDPSIFEAFKAAVEMQIRVYRAENYSGHGTEMPYLGEVAVFLQRYLAILSLLMM